MGLARILKNEKIREIFKKYVSFEPKKIKKPILTKKASNYHGLIGLAYEYLFRIKITKINKLNNKKIYDKEPLPFRIYLNDDLLFSTLFEEHQEHLKELKKIYDDEVNYFNSTGWITHKMCSCAFDLAIYELYYRSQGRYNFLNILKGIKDKEILELKNLFYTTPEQMFLATEHVIIDPSFERAMLFGGGDADLIIDDTLIEVKTSLSDKIKQEYIYQLLIYSIFANSGKTEGINERVKINKIGIYLARYAHLEIFNISEIISEPDMKNLFHELLKNRGIV